MENTNTPTYEDVLADRRMSVDAIRKEYGKLCSYVAMDGRQSFAGNPILYHYHMDGLCKVKTPRGFKRGPGSFYDVMNDEEERQQWWIVANKYGSRSRPEKPATRMFEVYRRCTGAVVFFKPTMAARIYDQYKPTAVLDVCAGWGGRMLGAMARNIHYTGIDTNFDLKPAYDEMIQTLNPSKPPTMIWGDALEQDFSQINYDLVLTSPPYWESGLMETYRNMQNSWRTEEEFYQNFLIPLLNKCRTFIRRQGKVCFNISPKMYDKLTGKYAYPQSIDFVPMLQQKIQGKTKGDGVYVWPGIDQ
jgi:hypothetical protein